MPNHFIRNSNLNYSPQIRLNVQNGNVDFNSPQISPLNDSNIIKSTNNNTNINNESKIKSKINSDNNTDIGVKRHVLKSFSSSSLTRQETNQFPSHYIHCCHYRHFYHHYYH